MLVCPSCGSCQNAITRLKNAVLLPCFSHGVLSKTQMLDTSLSIFRYFCCCCYCPRHLVARVRVGIAPFPPLSPIYSKIYSSSSSGYIPLRIVQHHMAVGSTSFKSRIQSMYRAIVSLTSSLNLGPNIVVRIRMKIGTRSARCNKRRILSRF